MEEAYEFFFIKRSNALSVKLKKYHTKLKCYYEFIAKFKSDYEFTSNWSLI